ncbi:Alpha/Beta hydrolase protein [Xylogone sp. PMI_703]|nr:Alpha/Beta hydrolase protein [Xylogone sp. PMI_703]
MQFKALVLAVSLPLQALTAPLAGPTVNLGYSTYQGVTQNGINKFLGMRYAAPPTGNGRWRAPAAPLTTTGTQDATTPGDTCMQTGGATSTESEDCLFINVYAPAGATPNSKLPVWFFTQGGGFADDASPNVDGTEIITNSGNNIVFVNFNYRVGIFGFLASQEIQANGNANAGLFDQQAALQWVQQHIAQFGGDPDHVVIHGQSAGAEAVSLQLIAFGGQDQGLFVGAMMQSLPEITQPSVSEVQFQYEALIQNTGCSTASDTLACLRGLSSSALQQFNQGIAYPNRPGQPNYPYVPTLDGDFLQSRAYEAFQSGKFVHVPVIIGDVTDEGTEVGAPNAASAQDVETFFQNNYPHLTNADVAAIVAEYPENIEPPFNQHAAWFPAAELAYGEALLTCVGINFGKYLTAGGSPNWNYRFNVLTSENVANGVGVPHGFDLGAVFGGGYAESNLTNVMNLQGYFISFVRSLNPNSFSNAGAPFWTQSSGAAGGPRLLINNNNTVIETIPTAQFQRCEFWEGLVGDMEI